MADEAFRMYAPGGVEDGLPAGDELAGLTLVSRFRNS
jgi:hypothetical protein